MYFGKYEAIVSKIKHTRKKHNKTQDDVASYLGITKQAYYRYEKGSRKMDINTIFKIANYFGLPDSYFLETNVSISHSQNSSIHEMLELFETLSIKLKFKKIELDSSDENAKKLKLYEIIQIQEKMLDAKSKIIKWLRDETNEFDYYE